MRRHPARLHRLARPSAAALVGAVVALGAALGAAPAFAAGPSSPDTAASLRVTAAVSGGAQRSTSVDVAASCESTAPAAAGGVDLGSVATAERRQITAAPNAASATVIGGLAAGTTCTITETNITGGRLGAVSGGQPILDQHGNLSGVRVVLVAGNNDVALTTAFPVVATVDRVTTSRTGSVVTPSTAALGSAAVPSDGTPYAGGHWKPTPRSEATTTSMTAASTAALPKARTTDTLLMLACIGVFICGVVSLVFTYSTLRAARARTQAV
jgi:hypothetical protein